MANTRKWNLTPEQWAKIFKAINEEKMAEEEKKLRIEMMKYQMKLDMRKEYEDEDDNEQDLKDLLFELRYGMSEKEYKKKSENKNGANASSSYDKINRIAEKISNYQTDVFWGEGDFVGIEEKLKSLSPGWWRRQRFLDWAQENLETSNDLDGDGFDDYNTNELAKSFNYADGIGDDSELEFMKAEFLYYLHNSMINDEGTGYLDENDIWEQIDLVKLQNEPNYSSIRGNASMYETGLQIPGILDFDDDTGEFKDIIGNMNAEILGSQYFGTQIDLLNAYSNDLAISNPELLKEIGDPLYNTWQTFDNERKSSLEEKVAPEIKNNGVDPKVIAPEIDIKEPEGDGEQPIFQFDLEGSLILPAKFESPSQKKAPPTDVAQLEAPTDIKPTTPKDVKVSSPAFASTKTRKDWAKVTGKKWHETA